MTFKENRIRSLILLFLMGSLLLKASPAVILKDTVAAKAARKSDKLRLVTYIRVISDARGAWRTDQNVVTNFAIGKLFRGEAGFRLGERPSHIPAYYHYKLELQTRYLWKTVRALARLSDNIFSYPSPSFRKTNEIFVAELRSPVWHSLQLLGGAGYVFSSQQNKSLDALPVGVGHSNYPIAQNNYPVFRVMLRYMTKKGYAEGTFGSYDVFNPYYYNSPFLQVMGERELSELCTLTGYFRYQYNYSIQTPLNYFFSLGLVFHLIKA